MSGATNQTWSPPPLDWITWNESVCDTAARWAGSLYHSVAGDGVEADMKLDATIEYLEALVPSNISKPTHGQLLDWMETLLKSDDSESKAFSENFVRFGIENCNNKICEYLEWEGDSDIAGVGMMVSFYIVAILTTIWVIVIAAGERWTRKKDPHRKTKGSNLLRGFQESSIDFLDATLVFAAAMILAAIVRFFRAYKQDTAGETAFSLFGSVFMSTFCVFPALALQSVTDREKTHWIRLLLWLVVILACIVLDVLYRVICKSGDGDTCGKKHTARRNDMGIEHVAEIIWEQNCEGKTVREKYDPLLTFAHVWLALNMIWWLYYVVCALVPLRWKQKRPLKKWYSMFDSIRKGVVFFNAVVCISLMFVFIGCYHYYTHKLREASDGSFYKDGRWSFGQVLALATWVPVIVQFLSVAIDPEKGMSARHSFRYKVVPVDDMRAKKKTASDQSLPIDDFQEA